MSAAIAAAAVVDFFLLLFVVVGRLRTLIIIPSVHFSQTKNSCRRSHTHNLCTVYLYVQRSYVIITKWRTDTHTHTRTLAVRTRQHFKITWRNCAELYGMVWYSYSFWVDMTSSKIVCVYSCLCVRAFVRSLVYTHTSRWFTEILDFSRSLSVLDFNVISIRVYAVLYAFNWLTGTHSWNCVVYTMRWQTNSHEYADERLLVYSRANWSGDFDLDQSKYCRTVAKPSKVLFLVGFFHAIDGHTHTRTCNTKQNSIESIILSMRFKHTSNRCK